MGGDWLWHENGRPAAALLSSIETYHPRKRTLSPTDRSGSAERRHSCEGTGPRDIAAAAAHEAPTRRLVYACGIVFVGGDQRQSTSTLWLNLGR